MLKRERDQTDKLVAAIKNSSPIAIKNAIREADLEDDRVLDELFTNPNPNILEQLLAGGFDVNKQNKFGLTLLHNAVLKKNIGKLAVLFAHMPKTDVKNQEGMTALDYAVLLENKEIILLFKKNGFESDAANTFINKIEASEAMILANIEQVCQNIFSDSAYYADAFTKHAQSLSSNVQRRQFLERLEKMKEQLEQNAELKNKTSDLDKFFFLVTTKVMPIFSSDGNFSVHLKKMMLDLIRDPSFNMGSEYANLLKRNNFSPFITSMLFIFRDHIPLEEKVAFIKEYVKHGINFNEHYNHWGNTILHFFISNAQSAECFSLLQLLFHIDGANRGGLNPNILATGFGTAPLHLAIAKGYRDYSSDNQPVLNYVRLVEELIAAGADVNIKTSAQSVSQRVEKREGHFLIGEQTPLHIACARRDAEFIAVLVENGAEIDVKNAEGFTPLDYLEKSYDERKQIIDSITNINNFPEYSSAHDTEEHLNKCRDLLKASPKIRATL